MGPARSYYGGNVMAVDLSGPVTQAEFGELVGISQPAVSQLIAAGVLVEGEPALAWLQAYIRRLREQAAGRSQALATERAALARSQREGQEIKNAVARREFAPIAVLGDVLGMASAGVGDRMDALRGDLRRRCPELTEAALATIDAMLADCRAEWVRATSSLVVAGLAQLPEEDTFDPDDTAADFDADEGDLPDAPLDL